MDCFGFLSWIICAIDVGLSSCVPGRFAMAASLFRAMMCFLSCFPETMYFSLPDVRSWNPIMPRSISGLVMRVASVGGGGFRAEMTSELQVV